MPDGKEWADIPHHHENENPGAGWLQLRESGVISVEKK
jgi:hypothetical protein